MEKNSLKTIKDIFSGAKEQVANLIKDTFLSGTNEVELRRYLQIGETDYDCIKRVGIKNNEVCVYYPNFVSEYAWVKIKDLSETQIIAIYKELCSQMLKNK